TPVLLTIAKLAAQTEAKCLQHFLQCSAAPAEHDSKTEIHNTNSASIRKFRFGFPLAANVGKEPSARRALLIKQFIATISVDPGSGGANQDLRRSFLLHQSLAKQSSSVDAAVANSPLCFLRPVLRDVLASEVDDRVPLSTIA